MRPEDRLLFLSTRQDFQESHQQAVRELAKGCRIDWYAVFSTAELHGVAPLVYCSLVQKMSPDLNIPEEVVQKAKLYTYRQALLQEQRARRLPAALALMKEASIDVMLFKGGALNLSVYDHPWYTVSKDIDVSLRCSEEEFFHGKWPEEEVNRIYNFLIYTGIEYDFFRHHDMTMNGILPVDFERIWDDARKIDYQGQELFIMSDEDLLLAACINACRKRFFRLKSLCDIAEASQRLSDIHWGKFINKARDYECQNMVYAAFLVTRLTLGGNLPDEVIDGLGVSQFRAAAINYSVHYLLSHLSLSQYPFSGRRILGRGVHQALILPYSTYGGRLFWRKIMEVYNAWKDEYEGS